MKSSALDTTAPIVNVSAEFLHTMARKIEKVHERMLRTSRVLKEAGVRFAVVGGNAVAIWVESVDADASRTTKDVDIVLERSDLMRAAQAMEAAGFELAEVNRVTMFLERDDPMPSRAVHVLFAGEKVRPDNAHPVPSVGNTLESPDGVPAIGLDELLVMKLQSNRLRDGAHIVDLLHVGLLTPQVIERVPADLRGRLETIIRSEPAPDHPNE